MAQDPTRCSSRHSACSCLPARLAEVPSRPREHRRALMVLAGETDHHRAQRHVPPLASALRQAPARRCRCGSNLRLPRLHQETGMPGPAPQPTMTR
jgi:hypothetical protein